MQKGHRKYSPYSPVSINQRNWPSKTLEKPPIWCSVDLRDGNQALLTPMELEQKLSMFKMLTEIGVKEIEIGFPSSSETEFNIARALIENNLIPDDVAIQVLVQARPHLIEKTFEAIKGAKNVIFHFYNSTSTLQRKVVFKMEMEGIIDIAVESARMIHEMAEKERKNGMRIQYEYSPESYSGTETDNAVEICARVMEALEASADNKVIINLPSTVELYMPNVFADTVEYFCDKLPNREAAIISVHPHNDRGTAVAAAELGLLAGADRIEGTLFGNGERTGNVDIITLAMNMFTHGIDPELDFGDLNRIKAVYEDMTGMRVHPRHPYAGELVFTAFSGSHQDAISKGLHYMKESGSDMWEVPYLPLDPADVGRQYEPFIRITSQSGKGGAAYILETMYGFTLPKAMQPEFGALVKTACEQSGRELSADEVYNVFVKEYLEIEETYRLVASSYREEPKHGRSAWVTFEGTLLYKDEKITVSGEGNGPIDAFFHAIRGLAIDGFEFVSYSEHAVSRGSDSQAAAYIHLRTPTGVPVFGVGMSHNINLASIRGVLCAINRAILLRRNGKE